MKLLYKLLSSFFSKRVKELELELSKQSAYIKSLESRIGDPREVVNKCVGKGIQWFDFNEMSDGDLSKYYEEAQIILNSSVWKNEKNRLVAEGAVECVKTHVPGGPVDTVRDFQMTINGMELLEEQFKSVPDPNYKPKNKGFDQFEAL